MVNLASPLTWMNRHLCSTLISDQDKAEARDALSLYNQNVAGGSPGSSVIPKIHNGNSGHHKTTSVRAGPSSLEKKKIQTKTPERNIIDDSIP